MLCLVSSCVPHITISVACVGPWIAPRPHGARPARGRGRGAAVGLLCLWRGGKSLDWTGEAAGLTGGRARLAAGSHDVIPSESVTGSWERFFLVCVSVKMWICLYRPRIANM